MRLAVVALLGIEITIIALASAASAATHPEGSAAPDSQKSAESEGSGQEAGSDPGRTWAFDRLMAAGEDITATPGWPFSDSDDEQEGPADDWTPPRLHGPAQLTVIDPPATAPRSPATRAAKSRVRARVARMPRVRPRAALRRSEVDLTRVLPRFGAMHMSHGLATDWLRNGGVRMKSTGNCSSKHVHHCTSLDSVRTGTIARMIELKRESGCPIMVTGGTEAGHASGQYSHGNGYKLDISHNTCIDRHITRYHAKAGVRSDGARLYRSGSGTVFADESDHWDILFR
ncbi:hypothetical protein ABZ912_41895 [Nonomuraea angiospora]|uniref:hypothetical protein n=1 Tax=Nonomuraea angiospora TaxID=46172 RepID=UPI0034074B10